MDRSRQVAMRKRRSRRTGVATLWLLISLPALLIVLFIVVDIGNLWVARVELENALEASALAAVRTWGKNASSPNVNWTNVARGRGASLAAANTVRGTAVSISLNQGTYSPSNPNENHLCQVVTEPSPDGNLIFGKITQISPAGALQFDAGQAASGLFGVRAQASVPVESLLGSFFGLSGGPYRISTKATAMYSSSTDQVRLVRIDQFMCLPGNGAD